MLPNGYVKVAAALPHVCADLRACGLADAWKAYCDAWHNSKLIAAAKRAIDDSSRHAIANGWQFLSVATV